MTLVGPVLDDRSYAQLRDELVKRIPTYAPEWTDHNETDPGITLLELFAHLGESLLYRFNQIPDATKVAFLRLLGVQPRPAQAARTLLVLQTEQPAGVQVLRGTTGRAGSIPFETDDEVVAWPLDIRAVGKRRAPDPEESGGAAERRRREDAVARLDADADRARASTGEATFYETAAVPLDPSAPDAEPLDVSRTVDQSLWVALIGKETTDPRQMRNRTLFLGVAFDETVEPHPFDLVPATPRDGDTPPPTLLRAADLTADPPGVLWELWNGPPESRATPAEPDMVPLAVSGDTTRGLTTTGVVKLDIPARFPTHVPGAAGSGDAGSPPPLDDARVAGQVVGWLRVRRPRGENDAIRRIRWVGANAVGAVQQSTVQPELLGVGTGDPGQVHGLTQTPVVPGSVRLEVEEPDGWTPWTEVDDFTGSTPADRHFTVDPVAGLVRFGSPRTRLPQIGERIRVTSYRCGGGRAGNVPAGAVTVLAGVGAAKVTNVLPATGGADAASLSEALEEVPAEVHRRDRAVTAEDFRALAREVSGVRRAETLANFHPDTPTWPAAGVVSVLVFPDEDLRDPGAPAPDTELLRKVARYLNERRLLTAELYVIPPTYRPIAVSVGVVVRDGYQVDAVRRWVGLLLRQYLAPVPPYGPDGAGWPLGRHVRGAELEAVAVQVQGVEFVRQLRLARLDQDGGVGETDLVELDPWQVPHLTTITVAAGTTEATATPPAPGDTLAPTPAPGTADPVLVPLPPDVC